MADNLPRELPPGQFTQQLRQRNGYTENELREWRFKPGMMFAELQQWWKTGTYRGRPHEGLDLWIFLDAKGREHRLPAGTEIPPLLSGIEVARVPDFLGETVILAHGFQDETGRRLHSFYAHLQPTGAPPSGLTVAADGMVGKIARPGNTIPPCPPHLHLSLAWVEQSYPIEKFRWEGFIATPAFCPVDPLIFVSEKLPGPQTT